MPNTLNIKVKQLPMLDYVSAGIAFYITMLPVQEWILEFRLGYLGRYWSLISVAGLFIGFLLCLLIFVPLIINMALDPFRYPDHISNSQFAIRSSQLWKKLEIYSFWIQAPNFN
ncbi:hypothetical protein H6G91_39340 [Nostoc muscorum FACHB-395]|nr:hypothetical protein [Desmonostoc muscorum FACHB-395]